MFRKKSAELYKTKPTEDGKKVICLTEASGFKDVTIRLLGIAPDEAGEMYVNYDVVKCPKKFDLAKKDAKKFSKALDKVFNEMVNRAEREIPKEEI